MTKSRFNIFKSTTLRWLLVWVLIPNLPFLIFWILGGPPRYAAIGLYYGVGILSTALSFYVIAALYIMAVIVDIALFTTNTFNLSILSILDSLVYIKALDPFASREYVIFGAMIFTSTLFVLWLYRLWQRDLQQPSFISITSATLLVCALDGLIQFTTNYHIGQYLPREVNFRSAVSESRLLSHIESDKPDNVLFVMVEGWGALKNNEIHESLLGDLLDEKILHSHEVLQGIVPFYGSTTDAEIRELCGKWGSFKDQLQENDQTCLPNILKSSGYGTHAFHGFTKDMFQREQWYPKIGFSESLFLENLPLTTSSICFGVFTGVCDPVIGHLINEQLKSSSDKQFIYWLTLNSHLPVHPDTPQEFYSCDRSQPEFGSYKVCMIANVWAGVFASISDILASNKEKHVSIMIVGDHSPPYWGRYEKSYFLPDRVPWLLLKSKNGNML